MHLIFQLQNKRLPHTIKATKTEQFENETTKFSSALQCIITMF